MAITGTTILVPYLIWRLSSLCSSFEDWSTRRWNLRVPDLQMSCRDLTIWLGTRIVAPAMIDGWPAPLYYYCGDILNFFNFIKVHFHLHWYFYTPRTTKLLGGILVSLPPSVRPSRIPCPLCVAATVLIGSISYLYILSSNFRGCVTCKVLAKFQNLNFWQFFKICNFDSVLFWLEIWCESLLWVTMGWREYLRTQAF